MKRFLPVLALSLPLLFAARASAVAATTLYVTNEIANTVSVIDAASRKITATISVGKRPRGIRAAGGKLYVALSGYPIAGPGVDEDKLPPPDKKADGIAVIDMATNKLVTTFRGVANPEQLAVTPNGKTFSGSEVTEGLEILNANTGKKLGTLPIPGEPEGVA